MKSTMIYLAFLALVACAVVPQQTRPPEMPTRPSSSSFPTAQRFTLAEKIQALQNPALKATKFYALLAKGDIVLAKETFDFTTDNREAVVSRVIATEGVTLPVMTYTPVNRFSLATAYHERGKVYLNSYKLNRPECDMVATLVHEYSHQIGYTHGNNDYAGKENSVPYYLGSTAESLCLAGKL